MHTLLNLVVVASGRNETERANHAGVIVVCSDGVAKLFVRPAPPRTFVRPPLSLEMVGVDAKDGNSPTKLEEVVVNYLDPQRPENLRC